KHNPALIDYPDPRLTDILKNSYGILTYQDDVLLTTITLAGYTWLDADKFRKAMGKKIPSEMKKQQEKFISGAVKNGLTQKRAEEIFELIAPFAGYGFNKAHAACYGTIAYRTAYLKAHFPVEFMTALLTAESRGTTGPAKNEKISQAIAECKRLSIPVLPPDINVSEPEFSIEEKSKIRFGLSAIKNVGAAAISSILSARNKGKFVSFEDFCMRVDLGPVNKKTLESLIKAGAMDLFGNRAMLLASMSEITEKIGKYKKQQSEGQSSLFGDDSMEEKLDLSSSDYSDVEDFSSTEKLAFEKEFLGFYLTAHPQADNLLIIKSMISHELDALAEGVDNGIQVKIGGIVETVKRIFTKKSNAEMAFVSISNEKGTVVECIIFPKVYELYRDILISDTVLIFEGKIDIKDDRPVILVSTISKTKPL
ncbi:MAG TPA: DNA polymerase III subunit alpha, partial [Patescibacteria group bacterium]